MSTKSPTSPHSAASRDGDGRSTLHFPLATTAPPCGASDSTPSLLRSSSEVLRHDGASASASPTSHAHAEGSSVTTTPPHPSPRSGAAGGVTGTLRKSGGPSIGNSTAGFSATPTASQFTVTNASTNAVSTARGTVPPASAVMTVPPQGHGLSHSSSQQLQMGHTGSILGCVPPSAPSSALIPPSQQLAMSPTASLMSASHVHAAAAASTANSTSSSVVVAAIDATCDHRPCAGEPFGHYVVRILHPAPGVFTDLVAACACLYLFRSDPHELKSLATYWAALKAGEVEALRERGCLNRSLSTAGGSTFFSSGSGGEAGGGGVIVAPPPSLQTNLCAASLGSPPTNGGGLPFLPPASACGAAAFARTASVASMVSAASPTYSPQSAGVGLGGAAVGTPFAGAAVYGGIGRPLLSTDDMLPLSTGCCGAGCGSPAVVLSPAMSNAPASFAAFVGGGGASTVAAACGGSAAVPAVVAAPTPRDVIEQCAKVHAHTERARLRRQLEEEERRMALEAAAKRERGEKGSASPGRVRRGSLSVGANLGGSRCGTPAQRSSAAATPRGTAQRKRASLLSEDSHHSSQQPMKSTYEDPSGAAAAAAGAAACNAYSNSDHHHELFEESLLLDADADAAEAERLQREQRTSSIALGGSERRVRGVEGRSLSVSAASSASAEGSSRQSASGLNRSPTTSSVYPPNPIAVSATAKCAPQFALPPSSPSPSVVAGARHPHPHHHHVMTTPTLLASGGTCSVDCPPPKRTSNDLLAVMHIGAATDADGGGGASVTSSALQQPSSMAAAAAAAQKGSLSPRQQQQQQHGLGAPQASSVMAIGDRDVSLPPSPTASAASRSSSAAALSAVAPSPRQQQDDQGRASPADTSVVQYVSAATAAAACAEERLSEDQLVEHLLTTLQYCLDTYFSHNWSSVEGTLQVNADHKAYVEREIIPRLARHRKEEAANGYSIAANKYTSTAGAVAHVTSEEAPPSQAPSSPSASASSPAPSSVPTSGSSSSNTSGSARPAGLAIPLPAAAADNNNSNSTNTHSNGGVCPVSASATPMGRADTNAFAAAEEALGADASAIAVASKDSTVANTDASSEEEEEEEDNVTPAGHPSSAGAEGLHITAPPAALQQGQNAVPASPNEAPPVSTSSAFSIPPNIRWATARNFSRLRAEAAESGLLLVFHAPFSQPSCQALMLFDALFRNELRSAEAAKAAWEEIKVRRRLPMCGPTESPTAAAMATPTASTNGAPASAAAAAAGIHKSIVALPSSAVSTSSAIYPYPSSSIASSSAFFATCVPEPPDFTPPKWAVVNSLREPILYNAFKVSWFPTIVYIPPVLADDDETDDGGSSCGGDLLADSSSSSSSFCDEESDACSSASDESVDGSSSSSSNSLEAAQPPSQLEAGGGGPTANNAVLLLRPPPRGRAATTAAPTPVQSLSIAQSHVTDPLPEAAVGPSTAADEQFTSIAAAQNGPPLPSSSSYQPPPIATESATTLCYQSPKLVLGDLQVQGEAPPTGAIGTAAAGSQAPPKMTTETINPLGTTTLVVGAVAALGGGGLSDPLSVSRMSQSVGVRAAAERRGEAIPLVSSASTAAPSESTVGVGPISTTDGSKRERIPHKQSSHTHHHAAGRAACTLARTLTAATDNHITYPEKGIRQPRYLLEWLIRRGQGGAYERRVKGTITTFAVLSKQKQFVSKRREISGALSLKKRQIHDPNPLPHSAEDPPVFVIMGGGMAAGKTTATSALEMTSWWRRHGNNAVVIDADEFKFQDPLFKANSPDLHRKSVEAAEQLLVDSLNEGRDIVFDGTMSWLPYVQQTLEMVRDAHRFLYKRCTVAYRPREGLEEYWERWRPRGPTDASLPAPYVVKFVGITVDPSRAVQRGILRRVNTGRSVPVRPQLRSFALFAHGFLTYAAWADSVVLYNNNVRVDLSAGQLPKVIAEKRHGQIDHSQFGGSATTTQNSNNYSQSRMGSTAGNSPAAEPREAGDSPPEQDTAEAASPPTNSSFRNTLGLSSPFSPSESLPRDHPTIVAAQQQQQQQFASNGSASGGGTAPLVSAPQQQQQQQQSLPFLFGGPATVNGLPPPPSCLIIHDPIAFSDFLQHTHINQNATSEEDLWLPKPVIPDWEKERLLRRHELAAERAADEAAEEAASQTANANGRTVPFIASSGATLKSRFLSAATTTSILGTSPSLDEYCPSTSDDEAETEVVTTKAKGSEEQSQSETNGEDQKAASNAKSDSGHGSASPPLIVVVPSAEEDSPLPSLDRSARPELALSDEARYIQQHFVPPNANAGAGIFGVGGRGHHQHHHHHHHHHSHRSPPPLGAPSAKARPPLSGQATEEVRNMPDAAAGSPLPLPSSSQPRRVDSEALSFPSSPAGTPTSLSLAQSQGPKYSSSHALGRGGNANSGSSPFVYGDGGGALRFPAMPAVLGGRGHLFASTDTLPSWANDSLAPLRRQCTAEIAGVMVPSTPPAVPLHRQQEDEKRLRRSTASSTETIT